MQKQEGTHLGPTNIYLWMDKKQAERLAAPDVQNVISDIAIKFGTMKCRLLILSTGKWLKWTNRFTGCPNECHKYLRVLEIDKIKEGEMKEQFTREHTRGDWNSYYVRWKLNGNNWAVAVLSIEQVL